MDENADKIAMKSASQLITRQVRLRLVHVDFWSAMRLSFLAATALAVSTVIVIVLSFLILRATGVLARSDEILGGISDGSISISALVDLPQVLTFAAILGVLELAFVTTLGAVAAGTYNFAVKVTGGLLVGFSSD